LGRSDRNVQMACSEDTKKVGFHGTEENPPSQKVLKKKRNGGGGKHRKREKPDRTYRQEEGLTGEGRFSQIYGPAQREQGQGEKLTCSTGVKGAFGHRNGTVH